MLGDSLTAYETLKNSDGTPISTEQLPFTYVDTLNATDLVRSGTNQTISGGNVFNNYYSVTGGSYLVYSVTFPQTIISQFPNGYYFQCSVTLDLEFSDISYMQFGCGFAHDAYSGRNLNTTRYPNNYMQLDGIAVQSPFYLNQNMYADFGAKVFPDGLNDLESYYDSQTLYFTQNIINVNENTASDYSVGSVVGEGLKVFNHQLYFVILCPVVNGDSSSENVSGPVQKRDVQKIARDTEDLVRINEQQIIIINNTYNEMQEANSLLDEIIALLTGLISALNSGQLATMNATLLRIEALCTTIASNLGGSSGGLSSSDIADLFELSVEDQMDIQADWQEMFYEYFPSLYDARDTLEVVYDDLSESSYTPASSVHYSGFSVQNTQIIPAMDVPLKPAGTGWDVFFDTLKVAVNVIVTFMFINGLRHRFDKTVLEDDS